MASRIVQYFADKLRTVKEYPVTLTKAVYDDNGNRLDNSLEEIKFDLSNLSYVDIPASITGNYGSFVNAKVGAFKQNNFAILFFSGQVAGAVDIPLSYFGIDNSYVVSKIFPSATTLAKADGVSDGVLTVKGYGGNKVLQLKSSVDNDYYNVLIPLLLGKE